MKWLTDELSTTFWFLFIWMIFALILSLPVLGESCDSDATQTPNMLMCVPNVGVEPGPQYAYDINAALAIIDGHNHTSGNGVPIPLAGMANLTANSIIGNNTGMPATPVALTVAQVNTMLGNPAGNPMTTLGDTIYGGVSGAETRLAGNTSATMNFFTQTGSGSASAAPVWTALTSAILAPFYVAPTFQSFLATGYYTFTGFTGANATAGATYTNNGHTFTVVYTIAGGNTLVASSTGAPTSSGTLTYSTGTGDATITFGAQVANGTYFPTNSNVLWIRIVATGGGGGGSGSGASGSAGSGSAGTATTFSTFVTASAGGAGTNGPTGVGGTGGSVSITTSGSVSKIKAIPGQNGGGALQSSSNASITFSGVAGGNSALAGGGNGAGANANGNAGIANTGGGGQAGAVTGTSESGFATGGGGGGGGYAEVAVTLLSSSYTFVIGPGGAGGTSGTGGFTGGAGAAGGIWVEEFYQ